MFRTQNRRSSICAPSQRNGGRDSGWHAVESQRMKKKQRREEMQKVDSLTVEVSDKTSYIRWAPQEGGGEFRTERVE